VIKFPIQLPKTLTTMTTNLPLPVMLLLTKLTSVAMMLASPVLTVAPPPVFREAVLLPVLADRLTLLTKLVVLFWVVVELSLLFTVVLLVDPSPLPEVLTAVTAPVTGSTSNSVPAEPAIVAPSGDPTILPIHLPAWLMITNHQLPSPETFELATLRTLTLVLELPVFTSLLPPVLREVSLAPVLVLTMTLFSIEASLFWKVLFALLLLTVVLLVESVPLPLLLMAVEPLPQVEQPAFAMVLSGKMMSPSRSP